VAFSPDGQWLASAGVDKGELGGVVRLWDAETGTKIRDFGKHTAYVHGVAFSPDGRWLATPWGPAVKLWDRSIEPQTFLGGLRTHIRSVAFSPDGQWLATGGETVAVWDVVSGQELLTLRGNRSVAFSPDGQRLASADGGRVILWDPTNGQTVLKLEGHSDVSSVAFSPDGQRLASAGGFLGAELDGIKVWDLARGQELLTLKGNGPDVPGVAFSPDGKRLAAASLDRTVRVWELPSGREVLTLKGHADGVTGVAFSPDGKLLASGSRDETVKLWDVASGQEVHTLKGHTAPVNSVAFSPDGKQLASGSGDGSEPGEVKVWDVAGGQETLTLKGQTHSIWCVAFSPDGKRLAAAGEERVAVWDARPLAEAVRREREALGYYRLVTDKVLLKDDVIKRIRTDPSLSEPVRRRALAWAASYREPAWRLDDASWAVVRWGGAAPAEYRRALRLAEAAHRLEPKQSRYLITLGVARYRVGQYQAAQADLTQADKMRPPSGVPSPEHLAFLALTQGRLGLKEQARTTLKRTRDAINHLGLGKEAEAQALLQEAEAVVQGLRP
jgi:WD40 repeat protein